ncbi:hypothetical protein U9M48_003338, partial [Paspalum notatum var. saurae]
RSLFAWDRHNIARVLIRYQWTGESLTCAVSSTETRSYPLVERKVAAEAGVVSNLRRDKWRWGKHMWERRGLVSMCHPGASSYSQEYKNRFESLMLTSVRMPVSLPDNVVIHLNMLYYDFMVLNTTCLDIPDLFHAILVTLM